MYKQNVLKLGLITFALFLNMISFGMFQVARLEKQLPQKSVKKVDRIDLNQEALVWKDFLVSAAAHNKDGRLKNGLHKTCKYFNKLITKTSPFFVGVSEFDAHPKDIQDIILFFSWYDKYPEVIKCLKEKVSFDKITFPFGKSHSGMWSITGYECSWPCKFELSYVSDVKKKYIGQDEKAVLQRVNYHYVLPSEAEIALVFAALCKDEKSVITIAEKVKEVYANKKVEYFIKMDLHKDLLNKLIEHDDERAFELIVKNDPYQSLNKYYPEDKTGNYDKPYLDYLMSHWYLQQQPEKKNKYVHIYKTCGGKNFEELEPKKNCIIS